MSDNAAPASGAKGNDPDVNTLRLSLILSGAISLGAYEAGVVGQIAYSLAKWNEERPDAPPLAVIDVISGASAGAMTGAMLASHLMHGGDPVEFVEANEKTWCSEETEFSRQLQLHEGDQHSFLSSRRIDDLANAYFYPKSKDPERVRQKELIFTCTLTALDKLPFDYRVVIGRKGPDGMSLIDPKPMTGSTQMDGVTFSIMREADAEALQKKTGEPQTPVMEMGTNEVSYPSTREDGTKYPADWERVKGFALASGAFPVAWQPMQLARYRKSYGKPISRHGSDFVIRYTDGGVLDNLPLSRAADVVECLQKPCPDADRTYVVIQPDPITPKFDPAVDYSGPVSVYAPRRDDTTATEVLGSVFGAIMEQSFDRDLQNTQKVNRRLRAREKFLPEAIRMLVKTFSDEQVRQQTEEVGKELGELLGFEAGSRGAKTLLDRYKRTLSEEGRTQKICEELRSEKSAAHAHLFILYMALADFISNLGDKNLIRIGRIFPQKDTVLAGDELGHFGGFLKPAFMLHDYVKGMEDAHRWLIEMREIQQEEWKRKYPGDSNPPQWGPPRSAVDDLDYRAKLDAEVEAMAKMTWAELPADMKERFSDLIIRRAADFIGDETGANLIFRAALKALVILADAKIKYDNQTPRNNG